jgi:hypothetical protein
MKAFVRIVMRYYARFIAGAIAFLLALGMFCHRYGAALATWWSQNKDGAMPVINVVAFLLALISAGLAVWSTVGTERISESLSTRFIGNFRENIADLAELAANAKRSVDLLWDGVDPGSYFSPENHERLMDALTNNKKTHRRVLVWGGPRAISAASGLQRSDLNPKRGSHFCQYYSLKSGFHAHLKDAFERIAKEHGGEKVIQFLRNEGDKLVRFPEVENCLNQSTQPDPRSPAFEALQLCLHEWIRYRLEDSGVHCEADPSQSPELFFLIADRREAIFVFPSEGADALSFHTRDSKLVDMLRTKFDQRFQRLQANRSYNEPNPSSLEFVSSSAEA